MIGLPTPEQLAELTAISRAQGAAGAPPPIAAPVIINEEGYAFGACPDGDGIGAYVHAGLRLAWAPLPVQGGVLLSIWGGLEPRPRYEEEGIAMFVTRDGLRRLAADLVAIADTSEPS